MPYESSSSEKTTEYQLTGQARDEALGKCLERIQGWGLKMPPSEVLVLDLGLGEFEGIGLIEFWIANEAEAGYCGKFLFVFDGQRCPMHRHGQKHETFYVLKGAVDMTVGGEVRRLEQGDVLAMAPGTPHSFVGVGDALLIEASMPCLMDDNRFDDQRIGKDGMI